MAESIQVLHVDDEPDFADITAELLHLADNRINVVPVTSPAKGLDRLGEADFDCIVSDYDMPKQNGLDFLKAVRSEYPDLPFILFTGKGSEEIASEAITAGVTDYLQKDFGDDQYTILANRIGNAVEQHRAVRQTDLSHRAMDTANEGLSLVKPDGTFSYANPAFAHLFGYDPDELIGEHWKILYHNEEAERLDNDILPAVVEDGYWSGETVRLTKQGDRVVTDHRLAHTAEGVIVCTAQDVTPERKDLAEQTTGFDLLVGTLEDHAFYTLDHEGYITRWTKGAERLTGYIANEVIGEHMSKFFSEDDRRKGVPERQIETATTEGSISGEGWRFRKDGSKFWADAFLSASYDSVGTIRGFGARVHESANQPVTQ